jgi:hypothetical protein
MDTNNKKKIIHKLNEIQDEILIIGWNGIIEKYHPDMNPDNPEASSTFKLYKHVYENIKNRILLSE